MIERVLLKFVKFLYKRLLPLFPLGYYQYFWDGSCSLLDLNGRFCCIHNTAYCYAIEQSIVPFQKDQVYSCVIVIQARWAEQDGAHATFLPSQFKTHIQVFSAPTTKVIVLLIEFLALNKLVDIFAYNWCTCPRIASL